MTPTRKNLAIKIGAGVAIILVVFAGWKLVMLSPVAILGGAVVTGFLVLLFFKIRANRKTRVIFGFYVAANEILVDGDGSRYHFETADVIQTGERIIRSMPDPPPLSRFALGALYSLIGEHNGVVEHLGIAAEEEVLRESSQVSPSRQLRRYVERLRQIERNPKRSPKIYAAIKSLEEMHQLRAARMFAESQQYLKRLVEAFDSESVNNRQDQPIFMERSLRSLTPPRPISELLKDIYQEEQQPS